MPEPLRSSAFRLGEGEGEQSVQFRILGPLEVVHGERSVALGGSRERALLALLLLSANRVVSSERLAEDLWAGRPPQGANQALRVYVSRLRKSLREAGGGEILCTEPPGYVARVPPDDLDAARFELLLARGRHQAGKGDHAGAAAMLSEALSLWRGPALADVADAPFAQAESARLEEARLAAVEERIEADLACGRHGELVAELDALTRAHPLRERLWAQRMVALYRSGRQTDALRAYQELRSHLGDELGLEPSAAVARLEGAILRHEPELDWPLVDGVEAPRRSAPLGGVVTFLFTDLVASTGWLERLGEDAAEELRRAHFSLLRQAVTEASGQEVRNLGDGLMAAFASPVAALGCAVAIQRGIAERNRTHPQRCLSVRVGLHAGEATRAGEDFFGTAVVVAKRLCDRADGGQILAGELVASLIGTRGDFRFCPLGPLFLRGLANPVPAVTVAWQEDAEAGPEAEGRPSSLPLADFLTGTGRIFVGREDEVDRLRVAWKEAHAGRRRVALVGGEPGIGKTRLAAVLAEELHAEGATVLAGRCDEDLGVPFQPFVEALRHVVDHTPPDHLPARLGRFKGELARLIPELGERVPGLPPPLRSDPETERYRLFDAVAAWLGAVAAEQPVVLVLDDLQWAAKPTLLLLRHVVRSPACGRLVVLGTYRDTEVGPGHPLGELLADLRRDEAMERLSLSGLDETEVLAVMERAAGHDLAEEERALARAVHAETDGNPFFVWEFVRHLTETGIVVRRQGQWVAAAELGIPEGVHDVVRGRLARLSETANRVLTSAAVAGTDFEINVLQAVCGLDEEGELIVALDEAAAARLVEETGVGAYRFVHALVRSALYETLSATSRARFHLRVADACEDGDDPARLAHHLLAAAPLGEAGRTARACLAAGDRALMVLADAEAAEWYSQGLTFVPDDSDLRIDLLTGLGEAQRRTGDPASRQTLLDASRLAAGHRDAARLVRAVLANSRGFFSSAGRVDEERLALIDTALDLVDPAPSADRAALLALQASELAFSVDHERRLRAADGAAAIAHDLDDISVRARVGQLRLLACLVPERVTAVVTEGAEVLGVADTTGDPVLRALSRVHWISALLLAGNLDEARRRTVEAMAIADDTGQPGLRALVHFNHAGAIDALGDHEAAERLTQAGFELAQEANWPDAVMFYGAGMLRHWTFGGQPEVTAAAAVAGSAATPGVVAWHGLWALAQALVGDTKELAAFLARVPSLLPAVPVDVLWLATHFHLGAAQGFGVQDAEAAAAVYAALFPYRSLHGALGGLVYWGPMEMVLGVLARVRGDIEGALAHHETAAATIEACGAARARAFNGYQWARTLLARDAPGDRLGAMELAGETRAYCQTKGYTTFVTKTEELLATVG